MSEVEDLIAEAIEENDEETSVAKLADPRSKRILRDAMEQADQAFNESDRKGESGLVQTIKRVLDEGGTLIIEGDEVKSIRKDIQEEEK